MYDIEFQKRVPIWNSISEFYLDTPLQDEDYKSIVCTFLSSGLAISELKAIDLYEVFPVLKGNLLSVAGIWNGFDDNWLNASCQKMYSKRKNSFFRLKIKFYSTFLSPMQKDHWIEIENRIKNIKASHER